MEPHVTHAITCHNIYKGNKKLHDIICCHINIRQHPEYEEPHATISHPKI